MWVYYDTLGLGLSPDRVLRIGGKSNCIRGGVFPSLFWPGCPSLTASDMGFLGSPAVLLVVGLEIVSRNFELLSRKFELISRNFELVSRNFEIISRNFEIVSRNFKLLSRISR